MDNEAGGMNRINNTASLLEHCPDSGTYNLSKTQYALPLVVGVVENVSFHCGGALGSKLESLWLHQNPQVLCSQQPTGIEFLGSSKSAKCDFSLCHHGQDNPRAITLGFLIFHF